MAATNQGTARFAAIQNASFDGRPDVIILLRSGNDDALLELCVVGLARAGNVNLSRALLHDLIKTLRIATGRRVHPTRVGVGGGDNSTDIRPVRAHQVCVAEDAIALSDFARPGEIGQSYRVL